MAEEDDSNYIGDRVKMPESTSTISQQQQSCMEDFPEREQGGEMGCRERKISRRHGNPSILTAPSQVPTDLTQFCSWLEATRLAWPWSGGGGGRGCDSSLSHQLARWNHRTWPFAIRPTLSQLQFCSLLGGFDVA